MKSHPNGTNQSILASDGNSRRDDARAASFLLAHQQLGVLALGTNPTDGQTITITINDTTITATFVSAISTTANNILIGDTAAKSDHNFVNWLRRPDLTTSTQVAASLADQQLLQYVGWAFPGSSTNIVPFSLNKNVNGAPANLTSFTISTTVTDGSWTSETMQLYVEDGTYYIGTTRVLFMGGSSPTVTAPVSNPRIDILTADSSGTLTWTTGTENATPTAPSYPSDKVVICELYNVVGETALYDNDNQQSGEGYIINDVRPVIAPAYISSVSQIAFNTNVFLQTGMIMMFGSSTAPLGWLNCDGSAVSRTTYSALFALVSTTFGAGDGSTTFNLPDFRGRVPVGIGTGAGGGASGNGAPTGGSALTTRSLADWLGEETHTLIVNELAAHTHSYPNDAGAGAPGSGNSVAWGGNEGSSHSTSSTGGGSAHNNVQPVLAINFIIKT